MIASRIGGLGPSQRPILAPGLVSLYMYRSSSHLISTRYRPALAALPVALAVMGLVACGASTSEPHRSDALAAATAVGTPPVNVVTQQQIAAYPAGSAAHALLEFWQALQFSDVLSASHLVSPGALASVIPARFATIVQTLGDDIPGLRIVSSSQVAKDASVRVFLLGYAANRTVSTVTPQSFQLRSGPHGYQLSDLSYFQRLTRAILVAQHKH